MANKNEVTISLDEYKELLLKEGADIPFGVISTRLSYLSFIIKRPT